MLSYTFNFIIITIRFGFKYQKSRWFEKIFCFQLRRNYQVHYLVSKQKTEIKKF